MKTQNILLVFMVIGVVLLAGCADRPAPKKEIQVADDLEVEEVPDEELPVDDLDLELDTENIGKETPPAEEKPAKKSSIDYAALDLDLEESEDEELPKDDVEELE